MSAVGFRIVEASSETNWFQLIWNQSHCSLLLGKRFGAELLWGDRGDGRPGLCRGLGAHEGD